MENTCQFRRTLSWEALNQLAVHLKYRSTVMTIRIRVIKIFEICGVTSFITRHLRWGPISTEPFWDLGGRVAGGQKRQV